MGFGVWDLGRGFGVLGLGFGVGFRDWGLGYGVWGLGLEFGVWGWSLGWGLGFRVRGLGFGVGVWGGVLGLGLGGAHLEALARLRELAQPEPRCAFERASARVLHVHPRVDARQSQKSMPRIYRGIDVKGQFPLSLAKSMAPTAEPNGSSAKI